MYVYNGMICDEKRQYLGQKKHFYKMVLGIE